MDWQSIPADVWTTRGMNYINSVNGVGVYYNPGTDEYLFTDETGGEPGVMY
jgi:hypothetical protein